MRRRLLPLLCLSFLLTSICLPAIAQDKIAVTSLTDLPVRSYPAPKAPSKMLHSDKEMKELGAKVRADIESMLEKYEIEDNATLRDFYSTLLTLDYLDGNEDAVLAGIEKVRDLQEKESAKLLTGITMRALIAAGRDGKYGSDHFRTSYTTILREELAARPWDVVQDEVQGMKASAEIFSENLLMGMVQSRMDPVAERLGELSGEMADRLIGNYFALKYILPLKDERIAALTAVVDSHKEEKPNIWPERELILAADQGLNDVVVGIWDSGVDASVFGENMWSNPGETLDGVDNDGNGFVDDLHGIAFDINGEYSTELLHPEGDQEGKVETAMQYMKGLMDLQAGIDSPEASELRGYMSNLPADKVPEFMTSLGFIGLYSHGTHVSGIASAGNPYARILGSRITFDYHTLPAPVTKEIALKHAESYAATAAYFRLAEARVVNMSWGWTFREVEQSLEVNGIGANAEERQAMTEEIFGILDQGLRDAIASRPEILFVIAAGNDDSDVAFHRTIPSSYELPNVMVVGAVDQAGERTGFTSTGGNVVVYANGFEVMSYVPGGQRMAMSGTSMASPNVANLAAKLAAVDPTLTPPQLITLIEEGSDSLASDPELKLINPKATAALLQQQ